MQLFPNGVGFAAVSIGVSATLHQSVPWFTASGAVLLVLTVGVALIAARSTKPAERSVTTTMHDRLLTTTSSQNVALQADIRRSKSDHFGRGNHPGQRWKKRPKRMLRPAWRRRQNMTVFIGLAVVAALLLGLGRGIDQYPQNIAINVGADLVGAIVTIFVIMPILSRAAEGRVREHARLDYGWYVDRVAGSTSAVRILDTYSNLLDGPHTQDFFEAVKRALQRQAVVQILLLDPDSSPARPRGPQLDDPDPYREIISNLRVLYHFHNTELTLSLRRKFSVHIYQAQPLVTMYRWDDKAMVSFPSVSKFFSQGAQLEITIGSPLGEFANKHFNALWNASSDLERFMHLPVTPTGVNITDSLPVEFVNLNGRTYLGSPRLIAQIARRGTKTARAYLDYDQQKFNELTLVDDTQAELHTALNDRFQDKYGHTHEIIISLEPITGSNGLD
jgi:hypothetical protein